MDPEVLRRSYMPVNVRVLFVGESPPAGGTFFYLGNSSLYRYTAEAFSKVYGPRALGVRDGNGPHQSPAHGFLSFFRQRGCYLEDLCLKPVNHLSAPARRKACRGSVPDLACRLAHLRPEVIVAVKKTLEGDIRLAMTLAGMLDLPLHVLPHPAFGNQRRYIEGLEEFLRSPGAVTSVLAPRTLSSEP